MKFLKYENAYVETRIKNRFQKTGKAKVTYAFHKKEQCICQK